MDRTPLRHHVPAETRAAGRTGASRCCWGAASAAGAAGTERHSTSPLFAAGMFIIRPGAKSGVIIFGRYSRICLSPARAPPEPTLGNAPTSGQRAAREGPDAGALRPPIIRGPRGHSALCRQTHFIEWIQVVPTFEVTEKRIQKSGTSPPSPSPAQGSPSALSALNSVFG